MKSNTATVIYLGLCFVLFPFLSFSQLRHIYTDPDSTNHIKKISFYTQQEGYIAFDKWIGFTQDSGRSFTHKTISNANVNFGNYLPTIAGFTIYGVHAFGRNDLLVYGDYGAQPSILSSSDGGNTFTLVYEDDFNPGLFRSITDMVFPQDASNGFAVTKDKVLQTTNGGKTWLPSYGASSPADLFQLSFVDNNVGYAIGSSHIAKTQNGGTGWHEINLPQSGTGIIQGGDFIADKKGWLSVLDYSDGLIYETTDDGTNWQQKNDPAYYSVSTPKLVFRNDTTGFALYGLYDILKTTDGGKIWEKVARDNQYQFLAYAHNDLFFYNDDVFWAGGDHGFLELSTNGSPTLPDAQFYIDKSQLISNSVISLVNKTKETYSYRWYKNSVLFSTNYNTSYTTDRHSIDTIKLVVIKGSLSDTAIQFVDTRNDIHPCTAAFTSAIDTAAVHFKAVDTSYGVVHQWDLGDGTTSHDAELVHAYSTYGTFPVKHIVHNTIDNCVDSTTQDITIVRTRNCLVPDFTYTADPFYTDHLYFTSGLAVNSEANPAYVYNAAWAWGDGSDNGGGQTSHHQFDSAKTYNTCLIVTHQYTGCVSSVCKPVVVYKDTTCNADFDIPLDFYIDPVNIPDESKLFIGKPAARTTGKRNTWKIDGREPVNTGNEDSYVTSFFASNDGGEAQYFNVVNNSCGVSTTYDLNLDSLNRQIMRIVYDSLTGCTDSVTKGYAVQRTKNVFIKAIPNPVFSQQVTFHAYEKVGVHDTLDYGTVWMVNGAGGEGFITGNYTAQSPEVGFTFKTPGMARVAIAADQCISNGYREVYYINYDVKAEACPVYPPSFSFKADTSQGNLVHFYDATANQNFFDLGNHILWDFGDGATNSDYVFVDHQYQKPGVYTVTLTYTNDNGCSKKVTKQVAASDCRMYPGFTVNGNRTAPATLSFVNTTRTDSSSVSYEWYFGTGDSSSAKNPVYTYPQTGTYTVRLAASAGLGCYQWHDSSIVIEVKDTCTPIAGFTVSGVGVAPAIVQFTNTSKNAFYYAWNFGETVTATTGDSDPTYTYQHPGTYHVSLLATSAYACKGTHDTTLIIPGLDTCSLLASFEYSIDEGTSVVHFTNTSANYDINSTDVNWDFGDGTTSTDNHPGHTYPAPGVYNVCLQLNRDPFCKKQYCGSVVIARGSQKIALKQNPVINTVELTYSISKADKVSIIVVNGQGKIVKAVEQQGNIGNNQIAIPVGDLMRGLYMVSVKGAGIRYSVKFLKQ